MKLFKTIKRAFKPEYEQLAPDLIEFRGINIDMLNPKVKIDTIMMVDVKQRFYERPFYEIHTVRT